MIWHNPRFMNHLSTMLVLLAILILLCALLYRALHATQFRLRKVEIESTTGTALVHVHQADVLANLQGRLSGNFFTVHLDKVQQALLSVPWVRRVSVRRVWPNTLKIGIEEHIPQAVWKAKGCSCLVNTHGEIFRIHPHDLLGLEKQQQRDNSLVNFIGTEGAAAEMTLFREKLQDIFMTLNWHLTTLELSQRYAWRAVFNNDIQIEFGREDHQPDLVTRAKQFVQALPKVTQLHPTKLVYADLRYPQGFAVRFQKEDNSATKLQFAH